MQEINSATVLSSRLRVRKPRFQFEKTRFKLFSVHRLDNDHRYNRPPEKSQV